MKKSLLACATVMLGLLVLYGAAQFFDVTGFLMRLHGR
jgi:hypothetical protein